MNIRLVSIIYMGQTQVLSNCIDLAIGINPVYVYVKVKVAASHSKLYTSSRSTFKLSSVMPAYLCQSYSCNIPAIKKYICGCLQVLQVYHGTLANVPMFFTQVIGPDGLHPPPVHAVQA